MLVIEVAQCGSERADPVPGPGGILPSGDGEKFPFKIDRLPLEPVGDAVEGEAAAGWRHYQHSLGHHGVSDRMVAEDRGERGGVDQVRLLFPHIPAEGDQATSHDLSRLRLPSSRSRQGADPVL